MVMPKVSIPSALRQYAGNQEAILVSGNRVSEVLADLSSQYPELKKHLFDNGQPPAKLRQHLRQ